MSSLQSGREVAHYRIVQRLAVGGMGEVYQAYDSKLERAVALKILPAELVTNPDRVRRFVQEARSASGLSHPHIVAIHDIGEAALRITADGGDSDSSIHYIAMELVDGATLKEKIHDQKSDLRDVVTWLAQAAEGLAKAHAAGIVHRDLKPENIMVTRDGYAKVLDFGLAKLTETRASETQAPTSVRDHTGEGVVLGTVGYMSPEQVQGNRIDHRSDVFSFGCILYEAATRQRPFTGDTNVDVMHQILHAKPQPVHELNPSVPGELRRMIRRCLAKDPEKRYQSMKDIAIELADIVDEWDEISQDTTSKSASSSDSLSPMAPPRAVRPLAIAAGAVVLLALAAGAFHLARRDADGGRSSAGVSAPRIVVSQLTTSRGVEALPTISPDGNYVAYEGSERGFSDIFLLRVGGRNPINLTATSNAANRHPAFSPDGQTIAFRSERDGGGLFLMGATGESVRRLTTDGYFPAWSPDGRKIVYSTEGPESPYGRTSVSALWVVDVASGAGSKLYDGDAVMPRWSPDGKRIAFWALPNLSDGIRDIGTIPSEGGEPSWLTRDAPLDWNPAWSPDGRWIYFSSDRGGSLNLWRIAVDEDGRPAGVPQPVTTPAAHAGGISISADGKRLAYQALEVRTDIDAIDLRGETATAPRSIVSGTRVLLDPHISPDGLFVVYRSGQAPEDLFIARIDGSEVRRLTDDEPRDRGGRWSPDGRWIVFYSDRSGTYQLWRIRPDGSSLQQLTDTGAGSGLSWYPVISPDGRTVSAMNDSGTILFDVSGELPVRAGRIVEAKAEGGLFFATDWSHDGRQLVGLVGDHRLERAAIAIYSPETGTLRQIVPPLEMTTRVLYGADGKSLLFSQKGAIRSVDIGSGLVRTIHEERSGRAGSPSVARSGSPLVFARESIESDIWIATIDE
jgi:eukaryotic-like serine/threonine-protein kinase